MTSKKPTSSKRAPLPRASDYTKTFLKDWERLSRSGRYDLRRLKEAMLLLLLIGNDAPLGPEWLDHPLKGDWADHRECHIGGDFLLIYRLEGNAIVSVRRTHVNRRRRSCLTLSHAGAQNPLWIAGLDVAVNFAGPTCIFHPDRRGRV